MKTPFTLICHKPDAPITGLNYLPGEKKGKSRVTLDWLEDTGMQILLAAFVAAGSGEFSLLQLLELLNPWL